MEKQYHISLYLDSRKPKLNGKSTVKLRVFTPYPRKQMLYKTKFEFTTKDFESIWLTVKPRIEHQEKRRELLALENLADSIAKSIIPFTHAEFEKKFLRKKGDGSDIIYHYKEVIARLKSNNSFSTASNYELSLKSLKEYIKYIKGQEPLKMPFDNITADFLIKYEDYMVNFLKRSRTTVSMYTRALRTVFNKAISEKEIDPKTYPFGKNKYQPPSVRNVKKALSKNHLKELFKANPLTAEQKKAKDFWFFSYACNGMNVKDIALLKKENIQDDKIIFYRAKTINTSRGDLKPITVYLNKFSSSIIKKYGNINAKKNDYVFSIISNNETEIIKHKKIKNFTKFINQNLKKLAISEGITGDISTYWARHSFATNSIRNGATMEFVMEALNHNNMKTTMGYFAGFEDQDKKEFMQNLMEF